MFEIYRRKNDGTSYIKYDQIIAQPYELELVEKPSNIDDNKFTTTTKNDNIISGEERMLSTLLCSEMEIYSKQADGTCGFIKFINPTQLYTSLILNDFTNSKTEFQMDKLSAIMFASFQREFLQKSITNLLTEPDYKSYNIYNHKNKAIFNSMDYIYIAERI